MLLLQDNAKYLGIFIDSKLSWANQMDNLCKKLRFFIYIFKNLRNSLQIDSMKKIYFGLVNSILDYGILGWGGVYNSHLEMVNITHRKIIKIMYNKPYDFSTTELFNISDLLNIRQLYVSVGSREKYLPKGSVILSIQEVLLVRMLMHINPD